MDNPIEVDGIRWFRERNGYYGSHKGGVHRRLHVYLWEKHHGAVPDGWVVHHIDHNRENNSLENLLLMTNRAHRQHHAAGTNNPNYGKPMSDHQKALISKAKVGKPGYQWTQSDRDRASATFTGRVMSNETKARMSESAKNRIRSPHSQETKDKIAEGRRRWAARRSSSS